MERDKKRIALYSILKGCFGNQSLLLLPCDIWTLIIHETDYKSLKRLKHTSHGFQKLIKRIGKEKLRMALTHRKNSEIITAKMCLEIAANCGNTNAMFHLGWAFSYGGWKIQICMDLSKTWMKRAGKLGNRPAYVLYHLGFDYQQHQNQQQKHIADLPSDDHFTLGLLYYTRPPRNRNRAHAYFESSSVGDNNEFAIQVVHDFFYRDPFFMLASQKNLDVMHDCLKFAAEQGSYYAMYSIAKSLSGTEVGLMWHKKAQLQEVYK